MLLTQTIRFLVNHAENSFLRGGKALLSSSDCLSRSLFGDSWKIGQDPFLQAQPEQSVKRLCERVSQRKQAGVSLWLADKKNSELLYGKVYSPTTRWNLSWIMSEREPGYLWRYFQSLDQVSQVTLRCSMSEDSVEELHSFLERRGGCGLSQIAQEDLRLIWGKFKLHQDYDAMVELFNCSRTSVFTSSPTHLSQYAFAHLNSSYVQPGWTSYLAERMLEREDSADWRFIHGVSLGMCARVAKQLFANLTAQKLDGEVAQLYQRCFPTVPFKESLGISQRRDDEAAAELMAAFDRQPNLVYGYMLISHLIEKGDLERAKEYAAQVWDYLCSLEELTGYEKRALMAAGLLANDLEKPLKKQLVNLLENGRMSWEEIRILAGELKESFIRSDFHDELAKLAEVLKT
jgi:predicted transcriptional regulator